jgi:hypothetical protein
MRAQDITGQWNGILKVQGIQLRAVFHISKIDAGYSSTMDSPDQGVKGMPVTTTTFENPKLKLEITNAKFEYSGELNGNIITGTLKQNGLEFPLNLSRGEIEKQTLKRPQEPAKPYPYYSENINFQNKKANITLAGTLTLPKKEGNFPAVILITGSGPQNRDEEVFEHKPFLVIADYLTKNGIAVLRYDDRGVAQSTGDFKVATTFDFASDVQSAISYLKTRKEINEKKIGLIGHSEGGIIAPIVAAAESKDVDFIVLLAGSGLEGYKLMLLQKEKLEQAMHIDEQEITKGQQIFSGAYHIILQSDTDVNNLKNKLNAYFKQSFDNKLPEEQVNAITNSITTPWMIYFLKYNPVPTLEKVKCPVLAIDGEKDLQVPPENLIAIKTALEKGGNKNVRTKLFPNLNHLFQDCKSGLSSEYSEIEETFSPAALVEITKWIKKQVD